MMIQDINIKLDNKVGNIENKLQKQSNNWKKLEHALEVQSMRLNKVEKLRGKCRK